MIVENVEWLPREGRIRYSGEVGSAIKTNNSFSVEVPDEFRHIQLPLGDWMTEGPIESGSDEQMDWQRLRQPRITVSGTMRLGKSTLVNLIGEYFQGFGFSTKEYIEDISRNEYLALAYENPSSLNILASQIRFAEMKKDCYSQAGKEKDSLRSIDVASFNDWVYAYVNAINGRLDRSDFDKYRNFYWINGLDLMPAPDLAIHLTTKDDQVVLDRTNSNARDIEVGLTPEYYLGLKAVGDEMFNRMKKINRMLVYVDEVDFSTEGKDRESVVKCIAENLIELGWDEYGKCLKS